MTTIAASTALKAIADSRTPVLKSDLINSCELPAGVLDALIVAYSPFGLIQEDVERGTVHSPHMKSRLMLRSLAFSIEEGLLLIDDWERDGSEGPETNRVLDRGAFVLNAFETRRVELGSIRPVHEVAVSKAIIKRLDPVAGASVLMMLNQSSGRFQLIGGKARAGEGAQRAAEREIIEELPGNALQHGRDYHLTQVNETEHTTFVSPTNGAYTSYTVTYFHVQMDRELKTTPQHRWVTLREVSAGKTDDGHLILPSAAQFAGFLNLLTRAPPSLSAVVSITPGKTAEPVAPTAAATLPRQPSAITPLALVSMMLLLTAAGVTAGFIFLSSTVSIGIAEIVAILIPVLFAVLVFVALGAGWINGEQFSRLFANLLGRRGAVSDGGTPAPKAAAKRRPRP